MLVSHSRTYQQTCSCTILDSRRLHILFCADTCDCRTDATNSIGLSQGDKVFVIQTIYAGFVLDSKSRECVNPSYYRIISLGPKITDLNADVDGDQLWLSGTTIYLKCETRCWLMRYPWLSCIAVCVFSCLKRWKYLRPYFSGGSTFYIEIPLASLWYS